MLLDNKTAIVYGAAGAVGSAVAHAYAREGDEGHLAGRTAATLEEVAQRIQRDAGNPHVTQLDVLDRTALERHAATVAATGGGSDVCFNMTSTDDRQGTPLLDMQFEDFLRRPKTKAVTAHFQYRHRSRSADDPPGQWRHPRHGRRPGSPSPISAAPMSPGARSPDSLASSPPNSDRPAYASAGCSHQAHPATKRVISNPSTHATPTTANQGPRRHPGPALHHQTTYDEVANIAMFAASDWARTITASEINTTGRAVID